VATLAGEPDAGVDRALLFVTSDVDGDGVPDAEDRCPVTPEDPDGFEDDDGCPEPDNDGDGLLDLADRCPLAAETLNGFEDDDGCPDQAPDADGDGIADSADRCPFEPETMNGVRDDDGCPEHPAAATPALAKLITASTLPGLAVPLRPDTLRPITPTEMDSDGDGIPDGLDRCPVTPEDLDGFEDEDGCPEPDNDGDGIPDAADRCPLEGETFNGWQDDDGCPDEHQDLDGDGFAWEVDRCPEEAGGPPDGCPRAPRPALALTGFPGPVPVTPTAEAPDAPAPAADFDRDGVPDAEDRCPLTPEDLDGFEDDDGCPEPDNDRDGVPDAQDKCPLVAETINGVNDDDGCPDVGVSKVSIQAGAVVIRGVVRFQSGSANLTPASLPLLREVASTLKAASALSVEIRGHTDDVGNAAQNIKLSKRRAETIRGVLIKFGVAPERLVATGFGPTKPVASNKTAAGREQNRRVEFLILGESK
jgi:outer membrane protein OmpA-like peptidoglycan-associated protein